MVATVQQETSADAEVLGVMTSQVTKGHSSDGAESRAQSRAGSQDSEVCPGVKRRLSWGSGLLLGMGSEPATLLLCSAPPPRVSYCGEAGTSAGLQLPVR